MGQYLDDNGLRYLWTKIKNMFIAKESGKGLSSNDYTTTEKNKLAGIANNANNYSLPTASASTLGGIKVGSGLSISNGILSASGGGESFFKIIDSFEGSICLSLYSSNQEYQINVPKSDLTFAMIYLEAGPGDPRFEQYPEKSSVGRGLYLSHQLTFDNNEGVQGNLVYQKPYSDGIGTQRMVAEIDVYTENDGSGYVRIDATSNGTDDFYISKYVLIGF